MTRRSSALAAALTSLFCTAAGTAGAVQRPVPVSPGHASQLVRIADRCPTFSWGRVDGAERYELVVYRATGDAERAAVALRARIDGGATSWTPTLDGCLELGGRYAWTLRARRAGSATDWSAPALFQVAPAPSAAEIERALELLRTHTAGGEAVTRPFERADRPASAAAEAGETGPARHDERRSGDRDSASADAGEPQPLGLSVEGRLEAGAFSGDGAGLANVEAAGLACAGCVAGAQLADGAVGAAKIGEACDSGQVLVRQPAGWACGTVTAPACTPGDEVGCYTGPAGTRGVGECLGGTRTCTGDSTWGGCQGEVTPAAAEACDGLDNTCDGSIDEGDPASLCPLTANVTATLCDAAVCAITDCAELWADADGDYANGCEAPAPGACLEAGTPRPIAGPAEGELVIQEILADPASPLSDADAEWFEVAVKANVDLNGLGMGTTFGTVIDQITDHDCLPVQGGDRLLLARSADPAVNGGLAADREFSFSLVNGGGELHLAWDGNLIDAVSWTAGQVSAGRASNLPAAFQDAASNDVQANWCTVPADAALLYSDANYGTPGLMNVDCP